MRKAVAILTLALSTSATWPGEKIERKGPLAGVPSPPGPHIKRIKALGDNEWLELGAPAPDPRWGKGRGASWGARMPYAPDLQAAFLPGQDVHGSIKPDGRYDDLFFDDLNAHRRTTSRPIVGRPAPITRERCTTQLHPS